MPPSVACSYWRLNYPFFCVHRSRDSQCFSMVRTTPNIVHFRVGSRAPSNTWFLGPTRVVSRFCGAHERDQQTHTHTERPRYSVCNNRPHLVIAAMPPKTAASDFPPQSGMHHIKLTCDKNKMSFCLWNWTRSRPVILALYIHSTVSRLMTYPVGIPTITLAIPLTGAMSGRFHLNQREKKSIDDWCLNEKNCISTCFALWYVTH